MKIQFVCCGNTFRSRLAEAYLKSKNISGIEVSSSGIRADRNLNGPVCDYTVRLLEADNLIQHLSKNWVVTDEKDLKNQDLVIFMDKIDYDFCHSELKCNIVNYEIWSIPDVPDDVLVEIPKDDVKIMGLARDRFELIKDKVDFLISHQILIGG